MFRALFATMFSRSHTREIDEANYYLTRLAERSMKLAK